MYCTVHWFLKCAEPKTKHIALASEFCYEIIEVILSFGLDPSFRSFFSNLVLFSSDYVIAERTIV